MIISTRYNKMLFITKINNTERYKLRKLIEIKRKCRKNAIKLSSGDLSLRNERCGYIRLSVVVLWIPKDGKKQGIVLQVLEAVLIQKRILKN